MARKKDNSRFWLALMLINVFAMIYPAELYFEADSNESQLFATLLGLGVALILGIADAVSAIWVYM